jgi:cytochrome c-type biogenesis protein CcmH
MMIFWITCVLLLLVALLFVVLPLWRGSVKKITVQRDSANLEIFRDQITEMDTDLRNGLLSQEMYEQGKRELQVRLLDEVDDAKSTNETVVRNPLKILAIALSVVLPLTAVGIYWKVGNPNALQQQTSMDGENRFGKEHAESALKELEEKVAAKPDDPSALYQLAHAYTEFGRFADAAKAYDRLTRMVPNEAQLWADYAEVMAMASGNTLKGAPTKLLDKALALDPDNLKALAFSGSAAMERGEYKITVRQWERLLKLLPKENENVSAVENGIAQARALMTRNSGGKGSVQASPSSTGGDQAQAAQGGRETITGTVVLNETLKNKVSPDDTLFVLVRAAEGPRMPLAIVRKQVKDLPLKFTLDDSTAMSQQMKMSNFEQVVVIARISKSGNAMTQPGDLQGMSATIKPGSKGIKLSIDTVTP